MTMEIVNNIRNTRNFVDESFQSHRPEIYDLFIYFSEHHISCAVAERETRKFIGLESREINFSKDDPEIIFSEIAGNSTLFQPYNYRRVIFCSGFNSSTLIPNPLYEPSMAEQQLKFSHVVHEKDEIITDELRQIEARNIFAFPSTIYKKIKSWFPNVEFHHSSTAMIEYLLSKNRNSEFEMMTVNAHQHFIEIIVTRGKEILLYNSYYFESPEELVYYILFACEQLHLNPENIDVQFAGEISLTDSAYMLARKYIRNTQMAERPS
ncbi:MAG TPA: DUF3822 family protein, partial [Bacteroidia bacterium]|nr:DUF3822 family protein [Bacteroidia bacterium]